MAKVLIKKIGMSPKVADIEVSRKTFLELMGEHKFIEILHDLRLVVSTSNMMPYNIALRYTGDKDEDVAYASGTVVFMSKSGDISDEQIEEINSRLNFFALSRDDKEYPIHSYLMD